MHGSALPLGPWGHICPLGTRKGPEGPLIPLIFKITLDRTGSHLCLNQHRE